MANSTITKKKTNFFSSNRVSLKVSSYNEKFIYFFIYKTKKTINMYNIYRLPNKKSVYTLIRSPFVNKKSRLQLGFKLHSWKLCLDYYDIIENYEILKFNFDNFLLNHFKKNLTSKYSVSAKFYRSSYFF